MNHLSLSLYKVIGQAYETHVGPEYVIKGNDVLMKCGIPSFVGDLVQVIHWIDSDGQKLYNNRLMQGNFYSDFVSRFQSARGCRNLRHFGQRCFAQMPSS